MGEVIPVGGPPTQKITLHLHPFPTLNPYHTRSFAKAVNHLYKWMTDIGLTRASNNVVFNTERHQQWANLTSLTSIEAGTLERVLSTPHSNHQVGERIIIRCRSAEETHTLMEVYRFKLNNALEQPMELFGRWRKGGVYQILEDGDKGGIILPLMNTGLCKVRISFNNNRETTETIIIVGVGVGGNGPGSRDTDLICWRTFGNCLWSVNSTKLREKSHKHTEKSTK